MGNVNLNGIFNYIAIKPCLSWFYFTTISMVTIWPNVIIPCSWTCIYWCFQKSPPPTPASHWPLHLWLWLTYPWSSGYQPFEIWHQTFCIVGVLDRAFFWFWPPILPKHIKQFKGAFHTLMEEMVTLVVCLLYSRSIGLFSSHGPSLNLVLRKYTLHSWCPSPL